MSDPYIENWNIYSNNSPGRVSYGEYAILQALLPRGPQRDILSGPSTIKPEPTNIGTPLLTIESGAGSLEVSATMSEARKYVAYNNSDQWLELLVGVPAVAVLVPPFDCQEFTTRVANATVTAVWQDSGLPWGRPFRVAFDHGVNRLNSTWDPATGTVQKSGGTVSWADHYQHATNAAVASISDALAFLMPITGPGVLVEVGFGGTVNLHSTSFNYFRSNNSSGAYGAVQLPVNGAPATMVLPAGAVMRMGLRNGRMTQELLLPGQAPRLLHLQVMPAASYPMPINIGLANPGQVWGPVYAQRRATVGIYVP